MTNLSFHALVRFPHGLYFEFNSAMNGVAVIDSVSREGDRYHANITFPMTNMAGCVAALNECSGSFVEIIPEKEVSVRDTLVGKYVADIKNNRYTAVKAAVKVKAKVKAKSKTKSIKIDVLKKLLTGKYHTTAEVMKTTQWKASTIHARFTGLRKLGLLQSKMGPEGYTVYRLKKSA